MKGSTLAIGFLGAIVLAGGFVVSQYVSYHDKAVNFEANIQKLQKNSESVLSNGTMMILDKSKVSDKYASQFKDALKLSIGSRNAGNQNLIFKAIHEQNPTLSPDIYKDLSASISGMRADFTVTQQRIMDTCAAYESARNKVWSGFWMSVSGYPHIDVNKACKIVSDEKTQNTFVSGVQTQIL
ncbi:hypothetical protein [Photobacterium damselae]|uniref:hypothetical protein n=1 Tax=Photobacterium damselae TaxID=38293 RepID=UPI001F3449AA|nr:hypothetical protein [Photobacterium damselae]UKA05047.1 hypothetical protein IHC89_22635 [Photobacterium damselae subsp. damselae]